MKAKLCALNEITDQGTSKVDFFGREVLVFKDKGQPKAVLNYCLHLGGPMELKGEHFVCAWHGAEFECHTGACVKGPSAKESRLMFLPTRIEEDQLMYVYGE